MILTSQQAREAAVAEARELVDAWERMNWLPWEVAAMYAFEPYVERLRAALETLAVAARQETEPTT